MGCQRGFDELASDRSIAAGVLDPGSTTEQFDGDCLAENGGRTGFGRLLVPIRVRELEGARVMGFYESRLDVEGTVEGREPFLHLLAPAHLSRHGQPRRHFAPSFPRNLARERRRS